MKQLVFILFTFCVISNAYAAGDCLQRPSCEELGYIQTRKQCECFNKDVLPCPFNIKDDNTVFCGDLNCQEKCKDLLSLYDGQGNTKKIVAQVGNIGLAAYATSLFYVGDKDGDFGQGKWYLPSIGEWMDFYGTDMEKITEFQWSSGSIGDKMKLIESALKALAAKGADAEILNNVQYNHYISSSMYSNAMNWKIDFKNGSRNRGYFHQVLGGGGKVRAALMIRNCFNPAAGGIPPKTGDVMYSDKTYGAVADYDGSKTPVGVVASVSENGRDVIILNLKDLTFNSQTDVNNFNPDDPYGETINVIAWGLQTVALTFGTDDFVTDLQDSCGCACQFYGEETSCDLTAESCAAESKTFNSANCTCEDCPTNYQFNSETKACEQIACDTTKVEHCATYNTECQCTACESGYSLSNGVCVSECDKSVDICAAESKTFNSANCTCEACPTNYQFNSETKACEQIACDTTKVEHCATYDSNYEPCTCQTCESGYSLSNGVCVSACDKSVDICAAESKTFNSANCTCEDCPSGYLFDNEVNECREACREDITYCAEYDSEYVGCKCIECGSTYYLTHADLSAYDVTNVVGFGSIERGYCAPEFCANYYQDCDPYCKRCSETEQGRCDVCADGFTLEDNKCIPPAGECIEGSVLYDDLNCYDPDNAPDGRIAIGVVFNTKDNYALAFSLEDYIYADFGYKFLPWSKNLANTKTGCNSYTDGQANTDCIIAAGAEENSAAVYCSKYGVTDTDKGKWFLPAQKQIYAKNYHKGCFLKASIAKALKKSINPSVPNLEMPAMSSTEASATTYEIASPDGGADYPKSRAGRAYCVLDFQKLK